jgi:hypothetical protein
MFVTVEATARFVLKRLVLAIIYGLEAERIGPLPRQTIHTIPMREARHIQAPFG